MNINKIVLLLAMSLVVVGSLLFVGAGDAYACYDSELDCATGEACVCQEAGRPGSCNAPDTPCGPIGGTDPGDGDGDDDDYTPPSPDFTISLSPAYKSVTQGQSTTYSITVNTNESLYGQITLSVTTCPQGASCSITPTLLSTSPYGSYPATLTITTTNGTAVRDHNFAVSGYHNSVGVKYAGATLNVAPVPVQPACTSVAPQAAVTTSTSGTFYLYAYGVTNATQVYFPTWGQPGSQDDLVWYPGTNMGGGTWRAAVNLGNHKSGNPEYGTFITHIYLYNAAYPGGVGNPCGAISFERQVAPVPVNGSCGTANGKTYASTATGYGSDTQCAAGASSNTVFPANGASVNWTCSGANGGSNASCSASRSAIPTPTNANGSCPVPGTVATVTWTAPAGYTTFAPRLCDKTINPGCNPALPGFWMNDSYNGTSWSIGGLTPGHTFGAWVHTVGSPSAASAADFVCQQILVPPAPDAKVTVWANWIGNGRDTPWNYSNSDGPATAYVGANYAISWGPVANATSCTLDGSPVSIAGGTLNTYIADGFAGDTKTHTITCTGPGGSGSPT